MSRYLGPRIRVVRRLGDLPGLTRRIAKRTNPPGEHGAARQKQSQFDIRLREKQKLRYHYGVTERQLLTLVRRARQSKGATGNFLLSTLERRLDNIVYRLGFAPTIRASRQLVTHGHICVNGRCVDISSFNCQIGDIISINTRTQSQKLVEGFIKSNDRPIPPFLALQPDGKSGRVLQNCSLKDIGLQARPQLSIEHYSRRA